MPVQQRADAAINVCVKVVCADLLAHAGVLAHLAQVGVCHHEGVLDTLCRPHHDDRPGLIVVVAGPDEGPDQGLHPLADGSLWRLLFITDGWVASQVLQAIAVGVSAVVDRADDLARNLPVALLTTAQAGIYLSQGPRTALRHRAAEDRPTGVRSVLVERLSGREEAVLDALCRGLSNCEIGQDLHIAETTVKTHVTAILSKFGVRDRLQLVLLMHRETHGQCNQRTWANTGTSLPPSSVAAAAKAVPAARAGSSRGRAATQAKGSSAGAQV